MAGRNLEELQQADNQAGQSPLHIEAENYLYQSGAIANQTCTDAGGGQNLTNIGGGSYAVYSVTVAQAGTYLVKFRVAGSGGIFQFKDSSLNVLATVTVPNTGSGQSWQTITATVVLRAGTQQVHFYCTQPGWNLNWLEFVFRAGTSNSSSSSDAGGYRYGFNGKENDKNIGIDDYDFGARIYDARIGRWLSLDPLQKKYPSLSPYNYAGNNPIMCYDPNGKEIIIHYIDAGGKPASYKYTPGIKPSNSNIFLQQVHEAVSYAMKNDDAKVFQGLGTSSRIVNISQTTSTDSRIANVTTNSSYNYVVATGEIIGSVSANIVWNPALGLQTNSGGGISASTLLLHEADHALKILKARFNSEITTMTDATGDDYQYKDDKRVITTTETQYVNKVNRNQKKTILSNDDTFIPQQQSARTDHNHGSYYPTTNVNSITPKDGRSVNGTETVIPDPFGKVKQDILRIRNPIDQTHPSNYIPNYQNNQRIIQRGGTPGIH